ncbi:MAG: spike base protein, RCAP_Rcc01079 family [Mangrovicoccus sp.]
MKDEFEGRQSGLTSPAKNAEAVTPNDSADLSFTSRAIYIGSAGDLSVEMADDPQGQSITLTGVLAGVVYPLRVRRVRQTGTTATGIVSLW